jgi:hypothetical protein
MDINAKIKQLAQKYEDTSPIAGGCHGFRSRKNYSKKSAAIT